MLPTFSSYLLVLVIQFQTIPRKPPEYKSYNLKYSNRFQCIADLLFQHSLNFLNKFQIAVFMVVKRKSSLPKHPAEGQYEHDSDSNRSFCYHRQSLKCSKTIPFFIQQ